jgi:hypothetical protein
MGEITKIYVFFSNQNLFVFIVKDDNYYSNLTTMFTKKARSAQWNFFSKQNLFVLIVKNHGVHCGEI